MSNQYRSVTRIVIALGLCCSLSTSCGRPEPESPPTAVEQESAEARRLIARGQEFVRSGDYLRAEQYFSSAIELGADVDTVLPILLKACIAGRRYRSAILHAEDHIGTLEQNRDHVEMILATLYLGTGADDSARKLLSRIVREQPNNAVAHFHLGQLLLEVYREHEQADALFRRYIDLDPDGEYAYTAEQGLLTPVSVNPTALPADRKQPMRVPQRLTPAQLKAQDAAALSQARVPSAFAPSATAAAPLAAESAVSLPPDGPAQAPSNTTTPTPVPTAAPPPSVPR